MTKIITLKGITIEVPESSSVNISSDGTTITVGESFSMSSETKIVEKIRIVEKVVEKVVEKIRVVETPCLRQHFDYTITTTHPVPTYPKPWYWTTIATGIRGDDIGIFTS